MAHYHPPEIRPGKWEILQSKDGKYYTRLTSQNGNILHENKGFESRQGAKKNIDAIIRIASISPIAEPVKPRQTPKMKKR